VESLRQKVVIDDAEAVTDVTFPHSGVVRQPLPAQLTPNLSARLQLLWDVRRLLGKVALWALAVSTLIVFLMPNKYQSSVSMMPSDSAGNNTGTMIAALAGKAAPDLAAMAGTLLGAKGSGALFMKLLGSRTVEDHIVDRFNLQKVYWIRYKQDARKELSQHTDVSEDRKSGVITVIVTDRSPQRAHDIAQAYIEELNRLMAQVSTSSARRERIFIEERLAAVKGDLEDAEKQFSVFASRNATLDIKEQTRAMVESAALLQGQMIVAQSELQSLEQIYTSNNVRVRSLRARVEELRHQLSKLGGTDSSLASDSTEPDQLYPSIRRLPLLGVEWADLYRRMKIQETVYQLLNQQYELARIQEAKEIPTINVVDPANLPEKKSFPPRLPLIVALTFFSVAGAALWELGRSHFERVGPQSPGQRLAVIVWKDTAGFARRLVNTSGFHRIKSPKTQNSQNLDLR